MRTAVVILATAAALALQTTVAMFVTSSSGTLDLVLVVVVFVALKWGPVPGLLAGAFGGLAQDCLSATGVMAVSSTGAITLTPGIIGVGGLSKTIVGFGVGTLAVQVIVSGFGPRVLVFVAATVVHVALFLGLSAVLDVRLIEAPYGSIAVQCVGNAAIGGLAFEVREALPGLLERRRERRRGIARRL